MCKCIIVHILILKTGKYINTNNLQNQLTIHQMMLLCEVHFYYDSTMQEIYGLHQEAS